MNARLPPANTPPSSHSVCSALCGRIVNVAMSAVGRSVFTFDVMRHAHAQGSTDVDDEVRGGDERAYAFAPHTSDMFTRTSPSKDKLEVRHVASTIAWRHRPHLGVASSSFAQLVRFDRHPLSRTQPHEPHSAKCSAELASANVRPAP